MASKMELSAWTSAMLCVLDDRQWGKCSMSGNCSEQTVDFKNNQQCTQNVFFGRITASMCTAEARSGYWESWWKFSNQKLQSGNNHSVSC